MGCEGDDKKIYIGIDLDDANAMVSFSYADAEPQTVSPTAGSEMFLIPIAICKHANTDGWAFGEEARRLAKSGLGHCEDHLFERAKTGEKVSIDGQMYEVSELFARFLRKMIMMATRLGPKTHLAKLVIAVRMLDANVIQLLEDTVARMHLDRELVHFMDYKESFYYYGIHQSEELSRHGMGLFEYRGSQVDFWCLDREKKSVPQLMSIRKEQYRIEAVDDGQKDELFARMIPQAFGKQIISTIYLVGNGFDSGWMKRSLNLLCQGRRVFLGKNLYSKGACYAAMDFARKEPMKYVYIGEHEMKSNVSLKVYERGQVSFLTLVTAGIPWYEAKGSCEVIVDGDASIDFWLQQPSSREAKIETLSLNELPQRKPRTTRLRIEARPVSDRQVRMILTDLGFGEIEPATNKRWEYILQL
ncbi:MAG: DUF5716 family protein [bacterium]|nr:DUF5716 family protein [bacterium]